MRLEHEVEDRLVPYGDRLQLCDDFEHPRNDGRLDVHHDQTVVHLRKDARIIFDQVLGVFCALRPRVEEIEQCRWCVGILLTKRGQPGEMKTRNASGI